MSTSTRRSIQAEYCPNWRNVPFDSPPAHLADTAKQAARMMPGTRQAEGEQLRMAEMADFSPGPNPYQADGMNFAGYRGRQWAAAEPWRSAEH
jgi:hypothetical protein